MIRRRRKNKQVEHQIQNSIEIALRLNGCVVFRGNVGKIRTKDGRFFSTGLPAGFPDLFGFTRKDGKIFFIEVKKPKGSRISPRQKLFHQELAHDHIIHGVAKSVDDALKIVNEGLIGYGYPPEPKPWI